MASGAHQLMKLQLLFWSLIVEVMAPLAINQVQTLQIVLIQRKSHVFVACKLMKYKKISSRYVLEFTTFAFFSTGKSYDVNSLFWINAAVAIIVQFRYTLTIYSFLTILIFFLFYCRQTVNWYGPWWRYYKRSWWYQHKKTTLAKPGKEKIVLCDKCFIFVYSQSSLDHRKNGHNSHFLMKEVQ